MFIPRELGIHQCNECNEKLIDTDFDQCGIKLQGEYKWRTYFEYDCPHCKFRGSYMFSPKSEDLPGNLFRQFADAIDNSFLSEIDIDETDTIEPNNDIDIGLY